MPSRTLARALRALPAAVVLVVLVAAHALAQQQDGFRITYEADRTKPERARITGKVVNERPEDVFEVNITAEALDGRGKVIGRGIAYVDAKIGRGDSRNFTMNVPTAPTTASFRVVISSYRAGFANQGP